MFQSMMPYDLLYQHCCSVSWISLLKIDELKFCSRWRVCWIVILLIELLAVHWCIANFVELVHCVPMLSRQNRYIHTVWARRACVTAIVAVYMIAVKSVCKYARCRYDVCRPLLQASLRVCTLASHSWFMHDSLSTICSQLQLQSIQRSTIAIGELIMQQHGTSTSTASI